MLYKQSGRNKYQARIWVPKLKKFKSFSTGTDDLQKAKTIHDQLMASVRKTVQRKRIEQWLNEALGEDPKTGIPLPDVWKIYLQMANTLSQKETKNREYHWRMFTRWIENFRPGIECLHDVDADCAWAFCDWLRDGRTAKTSNNIRANCRRVVEVVRRRISMENPFSGVATAPTLDSTRRRAFTESEISAILAAARGGEWYGPSLVALYTGLRLSDIRGLTWDGNFDQDMQFLHVRPQKTARHGITVAMPIHDVLRSYFQAQKRIGPLVFPELNVARRWGKWAKSGFTKVLEKARVPTEGATFHSWRHTFRTRLAAAGVSHDIARRLGGWTRELTAERYNHDTTELAGAISLLPAISASWQSER